MLACWSASQKLDTHCRLEWGLECLVIPSICQVYSKFVTFYIIGFWHCDYTQQQPYQTYKEGWLSVLRFEWILTTQHNTPRHCKLTFDVTQVRRLGGLPMWDIWTIPIVLYPFWFILLYVLCSVRDFLEILHTILGRADCAGEPHIPTRPDSSLFAELQGRNTARWN